MKLSALAAAIALTTFASAQGSGNGGGDGGQPTIPPSIIPFFNRVNNATIAHGTIMCLAFVIFFPAGSLLIRLGHFKGVVYIHAGIQMFAYTMALAGMGLGVYVANAPTKLGLPSLVFMFRGAPLTGELDDANPSSTQIHNYHPIIGLTILSALLFQPALGALHHAVYAREHRRSIWSTLHVWWGRVVLTLAIIEGGLGLRLADDTTGGEIAYGVVAALVWISWVGVAVWHDMKKSKTQEFGEKRSDSEGMTPTA